MLLERRLKDFKVGDVLVLHLCVHLDARHWNVACWSIWSANLNERALRGRLAKDRVDDLTVGSARATLLDLGIVDLQEIVEPGKQVRSRGRHGTLVVQGQNV